MYGKRIGVAIGLLGAIAFGTARAATEPSVARRWNGALLDAIRTDRPKPPVHARNLFHLSAAMWDAWAAYDPLAVGYLVHEKLTADDVQAAREEAISHAAYRLLRHRFPGTGVSPDGQPCQPGAAASLEEFDTLMAELGYDADFVSTDGSSPAALGNRVAQAVIEQGLADGANEGFDLCYPDDTGYFPANPELVFDLPGTQAFFPNHWQPLAFDYLILQNGIVIGQALQRFVGVGWADVTPFALAPGVPPPPPDCDTTPSSAVPVLDPGCPPQLGGDGDELLRSAVVELIALSSYVDPSDGVEIDISPGAYGNNPLGTDDGTGYSVNPATGAPYAPNVVKRADFARVVAEFWADGPESETPPGHWNVLANYVTDHPDRDGLRFEGRGKDLDPLEWDVKLYLALNGAMHDAAITAWGAKHYYDSSRPITLIRYMGGRGQSSDPGLLSYDPEGLPLIPGLIELITYGTTAPGERHQHLAGREGEIAIRAWRGGPEDPATQIGGVDWIRAVEWMPYQKATFVTPPFPGFISGHSTFSRAGAEVLARFTGDEYFPGGLGTFTAQQNEYLSFERGPSQTVVLQWATYFDASDEAGKSRRYGGIHPLYDDYPGRELGVAVGRGAFERARELYGSDRATLCHVPPGKPGRAHTIVVDASAVRAHMAHGDAAGECAPAAAETGRARSARRN